MTLFRHADLKFAALQNRFQNLFCEGHALRVLGATPQQNPMHTRTGSVAPGGWGGRLDSEFNFSRVCRASLTEAKRGSL